jgi:hypothetical protein
MPGPVSIDANPRISANAVAISQLFTLPEKDRMNVFSTLSGLVDDIVNNPGALPEQLEQIPGDARLFEVRIEPDLRAMLRVEQGEGRIRIIAIARPEQLEPYVKTLRRAV